VFDEQTRTKNSYVLIAVYDGISKSPIKSNLTCVPKMSHIILRAHQNFCVEIRDWIHCSNQKNKWNVCYSCFARQMLCTGNMEWYEMAKQSIPMHICVFLVEKFMHLADGFTHPTAHKIVQICCKATSLILLVFLDQKCNITVDTKLHCGGFDRLGPYTYAQLYIYRS